MKTAVVFFSLEGNTKYVAERIAGNLQADLIELTTEKDFPKKGLAKFYHGGKSSVFGEKPALKSYEFNTDMYDMVIIGCPVWAGHCASPMNTFFAEHAENLKALGASHVGIFLCQSGKGAEKVLTHYRNILGAEQFAGELVLLDPLKKMERKEENDASIDAFCQKLGN